MVKGKLIENDNYMSLRKKEWLLSVRVGFMLLLIVNLHRFPIWGSVLILGIYASLTYLLYLYQNKRLISTEKVIEIDNQEIRIKSKSGVILEDFDLESIDKLIVNKVYSKSLKTSIDNRLNVHVIELERLGKRTKLEFELETHYMKAKFQKMLQLWNQSELIPKLI